jgi:hypothetical protein
MSKRSIWDQAPEQDPPFLREMLSSSTNINIALTAVAAGVLCAIPFGLLGFAAPVLTFIAGDAIAAMYIPDMPSFRERVRARYRAKRRLQVREHLAHQLVEHSAAPSDSRWAPYHRILSRADSLRALAESRGSVITPADAERMEDAALDYLALWLTVQSIDDRLATMTDADIDKRLRGVDKQLEGIKDADARRSLLKAQTDLQGLARRRDLLVSRRTAAEAALIALPDAVEEVYNSAVTAPTAGSVSAQLNEVIERLRVEEDLTELTSELNFDLSGIPARASSGQVKH